VVTGIGLQQGGPAVRRAGLTAKFELGYCDVACMLNVLYLKYLLTL